MTNNWRVEAVGNLVYYRANPKSVAELRALLAELKFLKGNETVYFGDDEIMIMVIK